MDLVMAHKRKWSWRFVDEFCWRRMTRRPGGWGNRFKTVRAAFILQTHIASSATAVGHEAEDSLTTRPQSQVDVRQRPTR